MAFISWGFESLSFENMTQVPTTGCTSYLCPPPIWVRLKITTSVNSIQLQFPNKNATAVLVTKKNES